MSIDYANAAGEPSGESSGGQPLHTLWDVTAQEVPEPAKGALVAAVVEAQRRLTAAWCSVEDADRELQAALEEPRAGGVSVPQLAAILGARARRVPPNQRRQLSAEPALRHKQGSSEPPK